MLERKTRLQTYAELTASDRTTIQSLIEQRHRFVAARRDVVSEGQAPRYINVVIDGWGCRYKHLPDGRRQVLALMLPGDLCDANVQVLRRTDHGIGAITPMTIAEIMPDALSELAFDNPRIARALWWNDHVSSSTQREWIASLGQRSARERIATLFCEIHHRLKLIGRCDGPVCEFPLTQADVADATGLTPVHVNRMVQDLRRDRLIELSGRTLTILDLPQLQEVGLFTPSYLHLDQTILAEC